MSFGNSSMIVNTTINKYIRGAVNAIMRKRYILAKMQQAGCIKLNMSGKMHEWKVRHKRSPMVTLTDGATLVFRKEAKYKTAKLPPRAYEVTGTISEHDRAMNKGKEAIVDLWSDAVNERLDDIRDGFHEKIYQQDGYASGSQEIMGVPSAFGASASPSSIFGTNSDTYATLSTTLGNAGGSWTGTWPWGYGSSQYDYWTPPVVNYTSQLAASSGGFTSDEKTWSNNCVEAVRAGITSAMRNGDMIDAILLEVNMYRQLLDSASADNRLVVQRNQDQGMTKLGFKGINIDGVDILWEVGIPAGIGYGFCFSNVELLSWFDQLFTSKTDFNLESLSDRVAIGFFGNFKFKSLRGQLQFKNLS